MVAGRLLRFMFYAGSGLALLWTLFTSVLHQYALLASSILIIAASSELS